MEHLSLRETFTRIKEAGYDGIEAVVAEEEAEEFVALVKEFDLLFIGLYADIIPGKLEDGTLEHYTRRLTFFASLNPIFINSQTGKDSFSRDDNARLIEVAADISAQSGIPIYHEVHRGKFSFCPQMTMPMLDRFPEMKMTADISHWVNVSESFLEEYSEEIDRLVAHTAHIHARVGFVEGPQIPDPRAPEWAFAVEHHLGWWDRIVQAQRDAGKSLITISPEFGPYPYIPMIPFTNTPVADQWEINVFMKDLLRERYHG
jgi:sugar phosphate isomerase/epimerase